jgi:hypothetical protein
VQLVPLRCGIISQLFDKSVRVVIPQSYDFVETPGVGCGVKIHVKNEDKPWVMPATPEAKEVEDLLKKSGMLGGDVYLSSLGDGQLCFLSFLLTLNQPREYNPPEMKPPVMDV